MGTKLDEIVLSEPDIVFCPKDRTDKRLDDGYDIPQYILDAQRSDNLKNMPDFLFEFAKIFA